MKKAITLLFCVATSIAVNAQDQASAEVELNEALGKAPDADQIAVDLNPTLEEAEAELGQALGKDNVESAESVKSAESVESVKSAESVECVKSVESAESVKSVESAAQSTDNAGTTDNSVDNNNAQQTTNSTQSSVQTPVSSRQLYIGGGSSSYGNTFTSGEKSFDAESGHGFGVHLLKELHNSKGSIALHIMSGEGREAYSTDLSAQTVTYLWSYPLENNHTFRYGVGLGLFQYSDDITGANYDSDSSPVLELGFTFRGFVDPNIVVNIGYVGSLRPLNYDYYGTEFLVNSGFTYVTIQWRL